MPATDRRAAGGRRPRTRLRVDERYFVRRDEAALPVLRATEVLSRATAQRARQSPRSGNCRTTTTILLRQRRQVKARFVPPASGVGPAAKPGVVRSPAREDESP